MIIPRLFVISLCAIAFSACSNDSHCNKDQFTHSNQFEIEQEFEVEFKKRMRLLEESNNSDYSLQPLVSYPNETYRFSICGFFNPIAEVLEITEEKIVLKQFLRAERMDHYLGDNAADSLVLERFKDTSTELWESLHVLLENNCYWYTHPNNTKPVHDGSTLIVEGFVPNGNSQNDRVFHYVYSNENELGEMKDINDFFLSVIDNQFENIEKDEAGFFLDVSNH